MSELNLAVAVEIETLETESLEILAVTFAYADS